MEPLPSSLLLNIAKTERAARVQALRSVFKAFVDALGQEVRREEALRDLVIRDDAATTAAAADRLVEHFGAISATDEDRVAYLRWVIDRNRYIRSTGMVRNTVIQLPLDEIFISLPVRHERQAGDRAAIWFEREREALRAKLASGELDQVGYEAALDRLQLRLGYDLRWAEDVAAPQELPAPDAVRDNQHLLVLGDPGSGKTTLLRYLALRHAQALLGKGGTAGLGGVRLPIFVRIGDYARSPERHKGLGEFLWAHLRSQECPASGVRDLLRRALEAGDCLILLDGLDEIGSADDRRHVVAAVESLATAHSRSGNRFVVTSRISGYAAAPLPPLFTAVRVQDMDDTTIERFLAAYCPAVEQAEAPEKSPEAVRHDAEAETRALLDALRLNPGVRRLAANPLLLTALVLVHRSRGRLPHRRIEAYVEVTEALGRTWRSVQGVPEAELPDERLMPMPVLAVSNGVVGSAQGPQGYPGSKSAPGDPGPGRAKTTPRLESVLRPGRHSYPAWTITRPCPVGPDRPRRHRERPLRPDQGDPRPRPNRKPHPRHHQHPHPPGDSYTALWDVRQVLVSRT